MFILPGRVWALPALGLPALEVMRLAYQPCLTGPGFSRPLALRGLGKMADGLYFYTVDKWRTAAGSTLLKQDYSHPGTFRAHRTTLVGIHSVLVHALSRRIYCLCEQFRSSQKLTGRKVKKIDSEPLAHRLDDLFTIPLTKMTSAPPTTQAQNSLGGDRASAHWRKGLPECVVTGRAWTL